MCLCHSCGICMDGEHAHYSSKHYKIFIKLHSINICWVPNRLGFINGRGRMAPQGCLKNRFKASHSTLFHVNEWNLLKMCITLGVRSSFQQKVSNFEFCGQFWAILAILYLLYSDLLDIKNCSNGEISSYCVTVVSCGVQWNSPWWIAMNNTKWWFLGHSHFLSITAFRLHLAKICLSHFYHSKLRLI